MPPKIVGHAQQLLGFALVFLGMGLAVGALLAAGSFHATPFWVFPAAAVAGGAPLMVLGGRINARGRGKVLGQTPECAAEAHRQEMVLMALHFALAGAVTLFVIWPLFVWSPGADHPRNSLVRWWLGGSLLVLCVTKDWVTRPLWRAVERRVRARWGERCGPTPRSR